MLEVLRIRHVADAPAGEAVGLRQRVHPDRVRLGAGKRSRRHVPRRAVGEVLVDLVGDVVDPALAAQRVDAAQRLFAEHRAARVVRRDGDDRARAIGDRGPQPAPKSSTSTESFAFKSSPLSISASRKT